MTQITHGIGISLDRRLDGIGNGLLFLLVGALVLPSGLAEYAAVAGVGALLIGLNALRSLAGIPVRWFSIVVGTVALVAGVAAIAGVRIDAFALFFIALGVVTIGRAVVLRG